MKLQELQEGSILPVTLLTALDKTLGFPNKIRSRVYKKAQWFDEKTAEHVFSLEYRIRVKPGMTPPNKPIQRRSDINAVGRLAPGQNLPNRFLITR